MQISLRNERIQTTQTRNSEAFQELKRLDDINSIKFGMLEVHENEIAMRKFFDHLQKSEWILMTIVWAEKSSDNTS